MRKPFLILLSLLMCVAAYGQQSSITPESLRTWLTYLASDDLEGRATFSEGLGLAASYIAEQLKEAGVKPAGDHGSYFQRVQVLGVKSTNRSTVTLDVDGQPLHAGSYAHHPGGTVMQHRPAAGSDCLFVIMFHGPFDVIAVDD